MRDESPSWSHNSLSRNHSDSLFCVDVSDNDIGDSGATALVEALKETRNLKKLNLRGEFWAFVISRCDARVVWRSCRGGSEVVGVRVAIGYLRLRHLREMMIQVF